MCVCVCACVRMCTCVRARGRAGVRAPYQCLPTCVCIYVCVGVQMCGLASSSTTWVPSMSTMSSPSSSSQTAWSVRPEGRRRTQNSGTCACHAGAPCRVPCRVPCAPQGVVSSVVGRHLCRLRVVGLRRCGRRLCGAGPLPSCHEWVCVCVCVCALSMTMSVCAPPGMHSAPRCLAA